MIAIGQGEHGYRLPPVPPYYDGRLRRLPRWAKMWTKRPVLFSYRETVYRVISSGSHNNTPERARWSFLTRSERRVGMMVEYVRAVPAEEKPLALSGRDLRDFAESLSAVQAQGVLFTPDVLAQAMHVKWYRQ